MQNLKEAELALDKAKIELMRRPDTAFFTVVCYSMKHSFSDEIPTAATDGLQVLYNPDFFLSLNAEEQLFLVLHETMHPCLMHLTRLGERCPDLWNRAGDYVINDTLIQRGFKMPKMGLHDEQYRDLSTDEVYDLLPKNPGQPNAMGGDLQYPGEGAGDKTGTKGVSPAELEGKIAEILVRASIQSKMAGDKPGTIPGQIQIYLDNLLDPKLPWGKILRKYTNPLAQNDYAMLPPDRRFFPKYKLPSLRSEKLINLTMAIDVSGSITDKEWKQSMSESYAILKRLRPKQITLLQFDTQIRKVDKLKSPRDFLNLSCHGRGGTNIDPVIDWANEHKPELLLILSDGCFRKATITTKSKVIWLIHNRPTFTAPFGQVICYTQ